MPAHEAHAAQSAHHCADIMLCWTVRYCMVPCMVSMRLPKHMCRRWSCVQRRANLLLPCCLCRWHQVREQQRMLSADQHSTAAITRSADTVVALSHYFQTPLLLAVCNQSIP